MNKKTKSVNQRHEIIKWRFDDGSVMGLTALEAQDAAAKMVRGLSHMLREKKKANRTIATLPRPKARKVASDKIRDQYEALIAAGYEDKQARSQLLAKGKFTYQQIYRAVKKKS